MLIVATGHKLAHLLLVVKFKSPRSFCLVANMPKHHGGAHKYIALSLNYCFLLKGIRGIGQYKFPRKAVAHYAIKTEKFIREARVSKQHAESFILYRIDFI